jgi:hypothetical protein
MGARAGFSVVKASLGRNEGGRRWPLGVGRREVRDNPWFVRIEPKEPYGLGGEPFGPLGYILG